MAKVVAQGVRRIGAAAPEAAYASRVVSCSGVVTFGNPRCVYTEKVGQHVWLLEVKVFWNPQPPDATAVTYFRVMTGMTEPASAAQMQADWENVLPKLDSAYLDANWYHQYGITEMSWEMNRLYTGATRRFGVWMISVMAGKGQACQASFKISEV